MKKIVKWLTAFAVIGVLAGCARTAPIDNVNATVSAGHSAEQVKSAILKAGIQRQWVMNETSPGVISARQQSHGHVAEVRITYSANSYAINYVSSINLRASGGKIHKTYNRWIGNLDRDIQLNLASGAM
ncbi:lipoprotein [Mangrovibacter yixingensis]|uniref:hypothetical protein n=1 Tax=Mangrovibacter yixingensis TaxID=1529639 RepID=UPI001CFBBA09|nr:hypothetical protein [Mangrovibacter yixingensis]